MNTLVPGLFLLHWVLGDSKTESSITTGATKNPTKQAKVPALASSASDGDLWAKGVQHSYRSALRGEWNYVPKTLTQIDSQEYLTWNSQTGRDNRLGDEEAGTPEAEIEPSKPAEPPATSAGGGSSKAASSAKAKKNQTGGEQMLEESASVPNLTSKRWGHEAMLRFSLYSVARARKQEAERVEQDTATLEKALTNLI
ncbi:unnamed protein product [Amoebophrya sp. A25]|nr:unnamed protein product [Amoebophrya sp. A25]|eukprot:GSA25T00023088001.1